MKNFGKGLLIAIVAVILAGAFTLLGEKAEAKYRSTVAVPAVLMPSDSDVGALTKRILSENGLNEESAKRLPVGTKLKVAEYGTFELTEKGDGRKDCPWFLADRLLRGQSPAPVFQPVKETPKPVVAAPVVIPAIPAAAPRSEFPWWIIIAAIAAGMTAFALLFWRALDSDRRPPVVRGGIRGSSDEVARHIEHIVSSAGYGSPVVRSIRGRITHPRKRCTLVRMRFGDGMIHFARLNNGEVVWMITLQDGTDLLARAACGNLVSGRFSMPEGWSFELDTEPEIIHTAPARTTPVAPVTPTVPSTIPVVPTVPAVTPTPTPVVAPVTPTTPATTTPANEETVSVTITKSGDEIKVVAKGTPGTLPTKVEQTPDGKMTILFPKKEETSA